MKIFVEYKISARSIGRRQRTEITVKIEVDDPRLCPDEGEFSLSVCPSVQRGDDNGVVTGRREYPGGRDNFNDKTERGIASDSEISKCTMEEEFCDRCAEF